MIALPIYLADTPVLTVPAAVFADARVAASSPALVWPDRTVVAVEDADGELVARFDRPLPPESIDALRTPIVAGGANNQLATPDCGARLHGRGILYAPDYVINAGGIINVASEYLGDTDPGIVRGRIDGIPRRLEDIWTASANGGGDAGAVADAMAQKLIGRV